MSESAGSQRAVWALALGYSMLFGCSDGQTAEGAPDAGPLGMSGAAGSDTAGSTGGSANRDAGSTSGGAPTGGAAGMPGDVNPELVPSVSELIFSGVQNTRSEQQSVSLANPSEVAVRLGSIALDTSAAGSPSFELVSAPPEQSEIAPGGTVRAEVIFRPTGIGVFESRLLIKTNDPVGDKVVGLFGLGARGLEGENEPALKLIVDTLGFAIDVGGAELRLGTSATPIGDEVAAPRFQAATAAPVELVPVARYSPAEPIPYGYYTSSEEIVVGTIESDQFQTLNPRTQIGSKLSFQGPAGEFGLFTESETHKTYTEDSKNEANTTRHAVRSYPLTNRQGNLIENAYLVCFEEAANGDYQDYVFVLSNVTPLAL